MTDRPGPQKSADAYRTIGEVAEELQVPQHVLRFWETRFAQVKPLKRGGGRRFYRPEDVSLLRAVQTLLYGEGYTIKGVQRLLAEVGARNVADALARSRGAAPAGDLAPPIAPAAPRPERAARDDGDGSGWIMAEKDAPRREEPTPASRRDHAGAPPGPPGDRMARRLADVLADLAECGRLLASVRQPRT